MSQTETLLLVVLGFSLATLIALFIGRLLWTAALKLGARRMQKQVPSSLVGLQTERDRLRAEYAMLSQRLGSRLEAVKIRMAEQMAEVSRHRNRLETMEAQAAKREATLATLTDQVAALTSQLADANAIEAELKRNLAESQAALDAAALDQMKLHRQPALTSLAQDPHLRFDPVSGDRLRQRIGKLNELAHTVAEDRAGLGELPDIELPSPAATAIQPDPILLEKLDDAERQTEDLQRELEKLDAEWSKRLEEIREPEPGEEAGPAGPTAIANVISLANRIRDIKKGLGNT